MKTKRVCAARKVTVVIVNKPERAKQQDTWAGYKAQRLLSSTSNAIAQYRKIHQTRELRCLGNWESVNQPVAVIMLLLCFSDDPRHSISSKVLHVTQKWEATKDWERHPANIDKARWCYGRPWWRTWRKNSWISTRKRTPPNFSQNRSGVGENWL